MQRLQNQISRPDFFPKALLLSRALLAPVRGMQTSSTTDDTLPASTSPALSFKVAATPTPFSALPFQDTETDISLLSQVVAQQGRARCSEMTLPHYTAHTPMFMPVGTRGECLSRVGDQCQQAKTHRLELPACEAVCNTVQRVLLQP